MSCSGDSLRTCGGPNAISLYVSTKANAPPSDLVTSTVAIPSGWSTFGCMAEGKTGRALDGLSFSSDSMSVSTCVAYCAGKGFGYAGVEFGRECWCDDYLRNGAGAASTACTMPCSGAPGQVCGGASHLTLLTSPRADAQAPTL